MRRAVSGGVTTVGAAALAASGDAYGFGQKSPVSDSAHEFLTSESANLLAKRFPKEFGMLAGETPADIKKKAWKNGLIASGPFSGPSSVNNTTSDE